VVAAAATLAVTPAETTLLRTVESRADMRGLPS
jgi:hypothetical protein